jgi:osmoprotectant transport system permease protein
VTLAVASPPFIDWPWIGDHTDLLWQRTVEHIELTVIAVVIGFLISFPIAIYAHRHSWIYPPVTWITGILYTIPSLALFVLLIPFTGLSTTTAEIGLVSYTLLILIRNIVAGLDGVPEDVKDAARGMGYSSRQMLWRVELPLALPVIVAGVRIATVTTVGLVTVTALIGKGGLGAFILMGLNQFFNTPMLLGSVLSVLLAITIDALILLLERSMTPWARAKTARMAAT